MVEAWKTLPKDCWELIFSRLDDLEPISLVCKEFLLISSSLKDSLRVTDFPAELLPKLLKRFQHLKNIVFYEFYGDVDHAIHEIAFSGLNIESLDIAYHQLLKSETFYTLGASMKNLKTLDCSGVRYLQDIHLFVIADSLPCLEDLDISSPGTFSKDSVHYCPVSRSSFIQTITDDGIELVASKLKRLQKINLSRTSYISDRSLIALSSNCVLLKEILLTICDCDEITQHGIAFLLRNSRNLVTLSIFQVVKQIPFSSAAPSMFTIENSIHYAKALCALEFSNMNISDNLLCSISKAQFPLKKLNFTCCEAFSMSGLSLLLRSYQSLTYLGLGGTMFLTDQSIGEISQYLHKLTHIDLGFCSDLTNSTFFILTRDFPSLVEIVMDDTGLGIEEDFGITSYQNHKIQFLDLTKNEFLEDESLKKFGVICPNLQFLSVRDCRRITGTGIEEILKNCNRIQDLDVSNFHYSNIFGSRAKLSQIDDEWMQIIGKKCHELRHLNLDCCSKVTAKGVKEVVENCKKLRQISLRKCHNISADTLNWMVSSRPSLKIIPPRPSAFWEEE